MRRIALFCSLFALAAPAAAAPLPPPVAAEVDRAFASFREKTPVPGLAYGVIKDGELVHSGTFGVQAVGGAPVTLDTRFRIASMSKAFTALAILKLRDEGKLRLDDPAERYIPEMRGWTYPTADAPRIRVRDLLAHVAGFVTDDPWSDRQQPISAADFTRMIAAGVPFSRVPQSSHEYSNFGYALLGRIITNAARRPYQRYVEASILRPLGMSATGYDVHAAPPAMLARGYRWEDERWLEEPTMADGEFGAMGGIVTTPRDYAKWIAFLLAAWPARDDPELGPVKRSTVREMAQGLNFVRLAPRPGASSDDKCLHAVAYGMGIRAAPDCDLGLTLFHGGGYPGYGSFMLLAPERGVGAFAFANRTYQAPSPAVWQSLWALERAGLASPRTEVPSMAVELFHDLARVAYREGSLGPLEGRLAVNFLMDRSAAHWSADLAKLKAQLGACPSAEPLAPSGRLSTAFRWNCQKGTLDGQILLAPTNPPTLQALRFAPQPR